MQALRGTGVAIVTPFVNNEVDYNALGGIIEHCISGGVDYIVSLGTTGESATLTQNEMRKILDFTLGKIDGRIPLVAGNFGGNNTAAIVRQIEHFNFDGITAILSSSPAYNKPSQEGIYQHYSRIADKSPVPVIIYNVPGRTCSNVSSETTVRIAAHSNIAGVKEASGDMVQGQEIIQNKPDGFLVISGDDPSALELITIGGDGVISVIANAMPLKFSTMIRKALNGDIDSAKVINEQLSPVHPLLYKDGNPSGIKGALNYMELCSTQVRLPLTPITANTMTLLREELDRVKDGDQAV